MKVKNQVANHARNNQRGQACAHEEDLSASELCPWAELKNKWIIDSVLAP